jgi:hypothetical protein
MRLPRFLPRALAAGLLAASLVVTADASGSGSRSRSSTAAVAQHAIGIDNFGQIQPHLLSRRAAHGPRLRRPRRAWHQDGDQSHQRRRAGRGAGPGRTGRDALCVAADDHARAADGRAAGAVPERGERSGAPAGICALRRRQAPHRRDDGDLSHDAERVDGRSGLRRDEGLQVRSRLPSPGVQALSSMATARRRHRRPSQR